MSVEENQASNRRQSFRLDDTVTLTLRALDDESRDAIVEDFNAFRLRYCMKSHMQNQNEVRKPKLIRIKKSNPDIAEYLESLELQIAQLAERLDECGVSTGDVVEFSCRANLSATGIYFCTDMHLQEGQTIEIGMVLSSSNTQVVMLGEILRTEDRSDGKIAASVNYTQIHPEDSEAIIRHLARMQQLELQARRGFG